jgi:replicative DNA helicase
VSLDDLAECDRASHPTASTIPGYERAVINAWCERHLAAACGGALDGYKRGDVTLAEMLAIVREAIGEVEAGSLRRSKTYREIGEKVLLEWASAVLHGKERERTIPMPWYRLQAAYGGWLRGKFYLIGGRVSHHKTTVLREALQHAGHHGFRGLLRTLEDSEDEIAARGIASHSQIDTKSFATGTLPDGFTIDDGEDLVRSAQAHLKDREGECFRIGDRGFTTLSQLVGEIRAEAARGLDIVGIDYVQLIFAEGRDKRDTEFWRFVSATLAALAKELGIAIIATCQIDKAGSRASDDENRPPRKSDLWGGAAWEHDTWMIIMVYVVHERDEETGALRRTLWIVLDVAKIKSGLPGAYRLTVTPQHDRIEG